MSSLPLAGLLDLKTTGEQVNIYKVRKQVRRSPVKNINGLSFGTVATLTVFIYDYLCTLEDERRLVWPSRWSLIKVVYFLNRAIAFTSSFLLVDLLLIVTDGESCKRHLYSTVIMAQMTFVIGEVVLFMRVYAIWFCDKRMLALLLTVYVPGVVGATYATIHATTSAIATSLPTLFGPGCVLVFQSTDFWICYLVLLFHETFMLVLILTRAFLSHGYSLSRILRMVVKDGILYYLCVLGTSLANLLVLLLATRNLRTFLILTQGVIHSILCARLLLRLRGAYKSLTSEGLRSVRIHASQAASTTLVERSFEEIPMHTFSSSTLPGSGSESRSPQVLSFD
ncbi:hypothetical protein ACEPAH_8153 [Sanghuangporus vaninii]